MKMSIADVEKISNKSGLEVSWVEELLEIEIVPASASARFSRKEIEKLAKLAQKKNVEFWNDAMAIC